MKKKVLGDIILRENVAQKDIIPKNLLKHLLGGCGGGCDDGGGGCEGGCDGIYCGVYDENLEQISYGKCAMSTWKECDEVCHDTYSQYGWVCSCA